VEALEDRMVLSTFYAATASDLIADIKAANLQGGANTIVLTAPTTSPYALTAVDNTTDGATALPVIATGDALTIQTQNGSANPGYGDTVEASPSRFGHGRLFDVAPGASLTLEKMTLQGGSSNYGKGSGKGGAIYNQGTLVLSQVLVSHNGAASYYGGDAAGGGIWSNGSLTVENSFFAANSANSTAGNQGKAFGGAICIVGGTANITGSTFGGETFAGNSVEGGLYGKACGGAVYVGGGTVTMSGDTVGFYDPYGPTNGAQALQWYGGYGYGGGLCVAGGTVTLRNDSITYNEAGYGNGGFDNPNSFGYGGGIFIASGAQVYLDSFTFANTRFNYTDGVFDDRSFYLNGWNPDIDGSYILQTYPLLQVTGLPSSSTAGASESFTVTALANAGATLTSYTGTVHFTSSDPQAVLPADYTFTSADQGVHTFTADLKTAGSQTITATDIVTGSVTGSEGISVNAAAASNLVVAGFPSSTTAGVAGNVTVTARDPYCNVATGYLGTMHFTSSDGKAALPANYTFTAGDAGMHTFNATLTTAGTQSITATDAVFASISASETGIVVNPGAATHLALMAPSIVAAGAPFSITVTALDAYGNVATGYQGAIRIASANGKGNLPSTYTFTAADNGVHVFKGVALHLKGKHNITMTDTLDGTIDGSVTVNVV
jgi:hypothetical protein